MQVKRHRLATEDGHRITDFFMQFVNFSCRINIEPLALFDEYPLFWVPYQRYDDKKGVFTYMNTENVSLIDIQEFDYQV